MNTPKSEKTGLLFSGSLCQQLLLEIRENQRVSAIVCIPHVDLTHYWGQASDLVGWVQKMAPGFPTSRRAPQGKCAIFLHVISQNFCPLNSAKSFSHKVTFHLPYIIYIEPKIIFTLQPQPEKQYYSWILISNSKMRFGGSYN